MRKTYNSIPSFLFRIKFRVLSLFIGGAAGAMSRITGTLGKGVAALTMDDDYKRRRREEMTRAPENFGAGVARGGKGLVMVSGRTFKSVVFPQENRHRNIPCYQWLETNFSCLYVC